MMIVSRGDNSYSPGNGIILYVERYHDSERLNLILRTCGYEAEISNRFIRP